MSCSLVPAVLLCAVLLAAGSVAAQSRLYSLHGDAAGDFFGFSHGGIGDVDNDGHGDFAIGIREADANGTNSGTVRVYSGRTGMPLFAAHGDRAGDMFGYALAAAGDVDGDGVGDVIVGAPRPSNSPHGQPSPLGSGSARVVSGRDGRTIHTFQGSALFDLFGLAVSGGADVDRDGTPDLLVGAPQYENAVGATGYVRVYSGRSGRALYTFTGTALGDFFGFAAAFVGDVNGDGHADVLAGAPGDDTAGNNAGQAVLLSGKDGSALHVVLGAHPDQFFGAALDGAGDVDRDLVPDYVVGAFGDGARGRDAGRATVFSGASGAVLHSWTGDASLDYFGTATRGAGDLDADGHADLWIGTHVDGHTGYARAFSGRSGAVMFTLRGRPQDHFGFNVSPAGDVDGDGHADVIAGAHTDWESGWWSGSAHVFSGRHLELTGDVHHVSLAAGGSQRLELDALPVHGGSTYLVLGSGSGTRPGLAVGVHTLPLNLDGYLAHTLSFPGRAPLLGSLGVLSVSGRATAQFTLPPSSPPVLAGLTLHHAFLLWDGTRVTAVSNAVPATLVR